MPVDGKRIWIDIKNSHEPLLFSSLLKDLPYPYYITARDCAEITHLMERYGLEYRKTGPFHGKNKVSKAFYLGFRSFQLAVSVPSYDFFLSHGSIYGILASRIRRRPSITITDNDFHNRINRMIFENSDHLIIPRYLRTDYFKVRDAVRFDGFKEDIYVADFDASSCDDEIPFDDYVLLRPEAYRAYYLDSPEKSMVPEIVRLLLKEGMKIVLLPRYPEEREKYGDMKGVFIPERAVNGLCAAYRARAVLTGSGTMGREAAAMGVPSLSFFPGKELLSVDREMINKGLLFHSRDPKEISDFVLSSKKGGKADLSRSKRVRKEVVDAIRGIIER